MFPRPIRKGYVLAGALVVCGFLIYGGTLQQKTVIKTLTTEKDSGESADTNKNDKRELSQEEKIQENSSAVMYIPVGTTGIILTPDMDPAMSEVAFYIYIMVPRLHCQKMRRIGDIGDGGWNVCVDSRIKPLRNCLVYSFGIALDWSFDEEISEAFNCEVHSFDPSIGLQDHKHSEKIWFHNLGLSGNDGFLRKTWEVKTFNSILNLLNHTDRVIDILKMDVEESEWEVIPEMIQTGALSNVKQFLFELHVFRHKRYPGPGKVQQAYVMLKALDDAGFRLFYTHMNTAKSSQYQSPVTDIMRYSCMEMHFVNIKFY